MTNPKPEDLLCPCMSCQMERSAKGIAEPSVGERLDALKQYVSANKSLSQLFAEALENIERQKQEQAPKTEFQKEVDKAIDDGRLYGKSFSYDFARSAGKSLGAADLLSTPALFRELKKRIGSSSRDHERLQIDLRTLELDLEDLNND